MKHPIIAILLIITLITGPALTTAPLWANDQSSAMRAINNDSNNDRPAMADCDACHGQTKSCQSAAFSLCSLPMHCVACTSLGLTPFLVASIGLAEADFYFSSVQSFYSGHTPNIDPRPPRS